jgi:hypothetical protein
MALRIGFELRDFDLERIGFALSVLDESRKRQVSEGYLRMSLEELGIFLKALKASSDTIELVMMEGPRDTLPPLPRPPSAEPPMDEVQMQPRQRR